MPTKKPPDRRPAQHSSDDAARTARLRAQAMGSDAPGRARQAPPSRARPAESPRKPPATPRTSTTPASVADAEHKVAGENACRALFAARPHDIRRVYVTDETLPRFKDVLRFCAEQRIAYHVKTDDDLDQVAETVHHDGVLFLARRAKEPTLADLQSWLSQLRPEQPSVLVLLEGVKNPHNLGAILRVCAHFGAPWVLRFGDTPAVSPAVMRTAEGGAEHCRLVHVDDDALAPVVADLRRRGFSCLATSSHATLALGKQALPRRALVMFGAEGDGLSEALQRAADDVIAIPGSGALESLNVACAASVVLWELWQQASGPLTAKPAPFKAPQAGSGERGRRGGPPPRSGGPRGGRRG